jgi:hypothetical protein
MTGRRGVLELKHHPEPTATLTSKRGVTLFSVPVAEIRFKRAGPFYVILEAAGRRWRVWGTRANSRKAAQRLREESERMQVLTILPRPPGIEDAQWDEIMRNGVVQQRLWQDRWMTALHAFGAQQR